VHEWNFSGEDGRVVAKGQGRAKKRERKGKRERLKLGPKQTSGITMGRGRTIFQVCKGKWKGGKRRTSYRVQSSKSSLKELRDLDNKAQIHEKQKKSETPLPSGSPRGRGE